MQAEQKLHHKTRPDESFSKIYKLDGIAFFIHDIFDWCKKQESFDAPLLMTLIQGHYSIFYA